MTRTPESTALPVQFLTPAGELAPNASAREYASEIADLSEDSLKLMYRDMAVTRAFDQECTNLQRQGQLALWVPSLGQEAAQVGSARAAAPQDEIFPAYREHAVARIRGVSLLDVVKQFRGVSHGGWNPRDPKHQNFHLYTLVIGSQALHATGFALGQVLDALREQGNTTLDAGAPGVATGRATVVYFGDGATSQGDVSEAMVFAASYQTPQLFFVQNNRWAISVPIERQSRTPLHLRARGFGLNSEQIDGNDILASYAVSKRMLDSARTGGGPQFIEALTYRIGAHTTSDDPTKYREDAELRDWLQRDPLTRFETYLRHEGITDSFFDDVAAEGAALAHEIRDGVLHMPVPEPASMFAHVYSDEHPLMREQSEWFGRYEASFEQGVTE